MSRATNRSIRTRVTIAFAFALSLQGPVARSLAYDHVHVDRGDRGMVVSESAVASRIGRDVMLDGGNAIDAAVATAFALAVAWPEAGNLAGGGFMLVRPVDGSAPYCIDYRETAPSRIDEIAFSAQETVHCIKGVGVPGTIRGLAMAHQKQGRLPWSRLVTPAAELAEQGVPVDKFLARSINLVLRDVGVQQSVDFSELQRVYGKADGAAWAPGDRLKLPDLAATLRIIAERGAASFYTGEVSKLILDEMQLSDGLISSEDLSGYEAKVREVVVGHYRGYRILGAPPASSGGICVVQALNILENFDLGSRDRFDPMTVHLIAEASRRAFATRARFLGDPGYKRIPVHLTSKEYAKYLASTIDIKRVTSNSELDVSRRLPSESADTTHFSVVDTDGMAVSNTYTIRHAWGSRIVVRNTGILLNNLFGGHQWIPKDPLDSDKAAHQPHIQGGRRLLSSQSPTMVEKDGKLVLVTGSPGGRTIISTTLNILVNLIDFEMPPEDAVSAPRMHHQWKPDRIDLERVVFEPHIGLREPLERLGHRVRGVAPQGSAHSIAIDSANGDLIGIADYRRGGRPAGIDSDVIARWDFASAKGLSINQVSHAGTLQADWSEGLPLSNTNGLDCFQVRRSSRMPLADSILRFDRVSASRVSIELKIASALFIGLQRLEKFGVSFLHGSGPKTITAQMILQPSDTGIQLRGEALGGGEAISPIRICDSNRLKQPVVICLELDQEEGSYSIGMRNASESKMREWKTAKIADDRKADAIRLSVRKDVAGMDEWIDVDRIEIRTHPSH